MDSIINPLFGGFLGVIPSIRVARRFAPKVGKMKDKTPRICPLIRVGLILF